MNLLYKVSNSIVYRKKYFFAKTNVLFYQWLTRLLISNKRDMLYREKVYIWVPVWGEEHINMFFDYTLPSLNQENNLPQLREKYDVRIFIYTDSDSKSYFEKEARERFPNLDFTLCLYDKIKNYHNDKTLSFLLDMMKKCVEDCALMLLAMPDFIFANGSLSNIVDLANGKGVSIASSHPRISYEGVNETTLKNDLRSGVKISPSQLVRYCLKNKHTSLGMMDDLNDENSTLDGISVRRVGLNSIAVIHNLPSPFLVSPTESDIKFFKKQVSFNTIDKTWPAHVIREMRLKFIGSSEQFFCAELTKDNDKISDVSSGMKYNDSQSGIKPFMNCANTIISFWDSKE